MWWYLKSKYNITTNDTCSTHIHISLDPIYTTPELKRIASAIIHFEPAFEALVPEVRRNNCYVKSNWLDSPYLKDGNKTRSQLISQFEAQTRNNGIASLMQTLFDRDYAWNFWALYRKRTIEFRKPPACTAPEEILAWAELALSFIQAPVHCDSTERFQNVPATIGGLRWFVSQSSVPGVNEPARMQRLWAGRDPKETLQPVPQTVGYFPWEEKERAAAKQRLRSLAVQDERRVQNLGRNGREPYW